MLSVLLSPPYYLETGSLTEPGPRLASSKLLGCSSLPRAVLRLHAHIAMPGFYVGLTVGTQVLTLVQ